MIKTVSKNVGKGWAIFAGLFFLACAILKFTSCILPNYAAVLSQNDVWGASYSFFDTLSVVEILSYFSLALLAFSCSRANTALIPISALAFLIVNQAAYRIWAMIVTVKMQRSVAVFAEILLALFMICTLASLFFVMLEINVNVASEKGKIAMKLFATFAIILYVCGYGFYLIGDILEFFTSPRFETSIGDTSGLISQLVVPIVDNVKQLVSCGGFFFLSIWMATRPKTVEIFVEDKVTDEELFKGVHVDPDMIRMSEPDPEPVEEPKAEENVKAEDVTAASATVAEPTAEIKE